MLAICDSNLLTFEALRTTVAEIAEALVPEAANDDPAAPIEIHQVMQSCAKHYR